MSKTNEVLPNLFKVDEAVDVVEKKYMISKQTAKNIFFAMMLLITGVWIFSAITLWPDSKSHDFYYGVITLMSALCIGIASARQFCQSLIRSSDVQPLCFDFFLIWYVSTVVGLCLMAMHFNGDAKAWWCLILATDLVQGLGVAALYTFTGVFLGKHRLYTVLVVLGYVIYKCLPGVVIALDPYYFLVCTANMLFFLLVLLIQCLNKIFHF